MGVRLNNPIRTEPPTLTHIPIYLQSPLNRAPICLGEVNLFHRIRNLNLEAVLIPMGPCQIGGTLTPGLRSQKAC